MLFKTYKLIKILTSSKVKISFQNPKKKSIILFDAQTAPLLKNLLKDYKFKTINIRKEEIYEIIASPKFLFNFLKNKFFFLNHLKITFVEIYLYTLIEMIEPRIVITATDNSYIFSKLAKLLKKKISFFAVQNAQRYDYWRNPYFKKIKIQTLNKNSLYHLHHFFCFGQKEIDDCKTYKIKVDNFYSYGSIKLSNFFEYLKKKKIKFKKKFDICLISDVATDYDIIHKANLETRRAILFKYTVKLALLKKYRLVFCPKFPHGTAEHKREMNYHKRFLNNDEFRYLKKNMRPKKNLYSSYINVHQSELCIASDSTLLREVLGVDNKILACNFSEFRDYDFPIQGICALNNPTYDQFEKRVKRILNISKNKYFNELDKNKNYVMNFDKKLNTNIKIKQKIDEILER